MTFKPTKEQLENLGFRFQNSEGMRQYSSFYLMVSETHGYIDYIPEKDWWFVGYTRVYNINSLKDLQTLIKLLTPPN